MGKSTTRASIRWSDKPTAKESAPPLTPNSNPRLPSADYSADGLSHGKACGAVRKTADAENGIKK